MNTRISSLLVAALLMAGASAQEEQKAPATKKESAQSGQVPVKDLIQRLGDSDYQVRRKAESDLRARGKEALQDLKQAAESSTDEEVRWRARRIVRQLEEGGEAGTLRKRAEQANPDLPAPQGAIPRLRVRNLPQGGDLDDVFNQMFERMERQFGIDIPRQRFFHDDFFKDLERQMEDVTRHGGNGQGQSMQMNIVPDGVKVRVEEKGADGKTETKTYEAPDMDAFRSKYPDVAKRYFDGNNGLHMQFGVPHLRLWQGNPMLTPVEPVEPDIADQPLDPKSFDAIPPGERLGVTIEPIDDQLRSDLGLEDGQGMRVHEVLTGSLADKLGIKQGDIVTKVAGKPIHETTDVREALRTVPGGTKVLVEVQRKGKPMTLEAEKAETKTDAPAESKKELKKKKKPEIR